MLSCFLDRVRSTRWTPLASTPLPWCCFCHGRSKPFSLVAIFVVCLDTRKNENSLTTPLHTCFAQELAAESRLDASFAYYAVQSLRERLRAIGSDLVVRSGDAAREVTRVVSETGATHVFFHKRFIRRGLLVLPFIYSAGFCIAVKKRVPSC